MSGDEGVKGGTDQGDKAGSQSGAGKGAPDTVNQGGEGGESKTFTQEQVNEIVSRRVNEINKKYEPMERSHKILQNMMTDPEFRQWLEDKSSGKQTGESKKEGADPNEIFQTLTQKDPELAPVIKKLVDAMVEERVGPIQNVAMKADATASNASIKAEVRDMEEAVDEEGNLLYPWMLEQEFKNDMADIMEQQRAFTLADAYDIAAAARIRQGKQPPAVKRTQLRRQKKEAELLESDEHGSGTGAGGKATESKPKVFKSFEECFDAVASERGWFK